MWQALKMLFNSQTAQIGSLSIKVWQVVLAVIVVTVGVASAYTYSHVTQKSMLFGQNQASVKGKVTQRTLPVPSTETSCPTPGKARAVVTAPLVLGTHQNIVYIYNEDAPTLGILKRYDVTAAQTSEIVRIANARILYAQVSADGRWILFVSYRANQSMLQMIRVDAQGLQTLYCTYDSISQPSWSPDQKWIAFTSYHSLSSPPATSTTLTLLKTTDGMQQAQQLPHDRDFEMLAPLAWIDNTHLSIESSSLYLHHAIYELYALDISKGFTFTKMPGIHAEGDWLEASFTISQDGTKLFTNTYEFGQGVAAGPGSITVQPITGGSPRTIYSNPAFAIEQIQVGANSLLFDMENSDLNPSSNLDTHQNGIWKINMDGSGLTRLVPMIRGDSANLSGISGDGNMYALKLYTYNYSSQTTTPTLVFGSLSGGAPTFAVSSDKAELNIIGWDTI